jgi:hypothetical protein
VKNNNQEENNLLKETRRPIHEVEQLKQENKLMKLEL